jgi:predicted nucleotidyltransferase
MRLENKVKNIVENVISKTEFTLDSMFLFGSQARGDFREGSDYDILIVLKDGIPIRERRKLAGRILSELHKEIEFIPFDVIIKCLKDFEEEKEIVNTISNEVLREGVKL